MRTIHLVARCPLMIQLQPPMMIRLAVRHPRPQQHPHLLPMPMCSTRQLHLAMREQRKPLAQEPEMAVELVPVGIDL